MMALGGDLQNALIWSRAACCAVGPDRWRALPSSPAVGWPAVDRAQWMPAMDFARDSYRAGLQYSEAVSARFIRSADGVVHSQLFGNRDTGSGLR